MRFHYILAVILVLGSLVLIAGAQAESIPGPPVAPRTESPLTAGVGEVNMELIVLSVGIVGLVFVVVAIADAVDWKRKREDEAVRLHAQISDALRCERTLAKLPVTPTVHVPEWGRSSARIEMSGQVPTAELWQAVRHVAEQEASRTLDAFHIDDRIAVVPSVRARAS